MAISAALPRPGAHPWPIDTIPDPEVPERPTRRRFTAACKMAILDGYEAVTEPGAKGALLRREGLYSSHITEWRRLRALGGLEALGRSRGPRPAHPLARPTARVRNQIHADLVVPMPGYQNVAQNLVAAGHRRAIARGLRRLGGVQAELALGRLARLRALDAETSDVRRFRSPDAFAALAGVAPIPASSGQTQRMRLSRGGNCQLNRALHTIATVQAAHHPPAQTYLARKRTEQKSSREAIRALKRQLVRTVFRLLREGAPGLGMAA